MYRSTFYLPRQLLEVSGQLHAPAALTHGKTAPSTHWTGGWVGPRTGLHDMEKKTFLTLPVLKLRRLCRPARSQSLYRIRYAGSYNKIIWNNNSNFAYHKLD
jgi:hypothetical protein